MAAPSDKLQNYPIPTLPQLPGGDPIFWRSELSKISKAINLLVKTVQKINTDPVTFAKLPTAPFVGQEVVVTDSTTTTWGANITTGGGSSTVLAHWNGTHWTVAAI